MLCRAMQNALDDAGPRSPEGSPEIAVTSPRSIGAGVEAVALEPELVQPRPHQQELPVRPPREVDHLGEHLRIELVQEGHPKASVCDAGREGRILLQHSIEAWDPDRYVQSGDVGARDLDAWKLARDRRCQQGEDRDGGQDARHLPPPW